MKNTMPSPTIGAAWPDCRGGDFIWCPDHWGIAPQPPVLDGRFNVSLCPDHRAPSKTLPSGAQRARVMPRAQGTGHGTERPYTTED